MVKVKAAMDQYIEGLEDLGLLGFIRNDPFKWKVFFIASEVNKLTAGKLLNFKKCSITCV